MDDRQNPIDSPESPEQSVTVTAASPEAKPKSPKKQRRSLSRNRKIVLILSIVVGLLAVLAVGALVWRLHRDKAADDAAANASLTVRYIDVGQGDGILLESDGDYMLIDAGGDDAHQHAVTEFLQEQGVTKLEYAVITHPHADHIQDMEEIVESLPVGTFLMPDLTYESTGYDYLLSALKERKISTVYAESGQTYPFGTCTVEVLGPVTTSVDDLNDACAVIRVVCGKTSFLFTGDCTGTEENALLDSGCDLSADVLKVGHHGSEYSSTEEFLQAVSPEYAVISCGADNEYGHPDRETLDRLNAVGAEIYRTDTQGTITAVSDGFSITFQTEH